MATYDLTSTTPNKIKTGDILNCPYSGFAKQITLPKGQYKLECWGAQGGYRSSSSYGGHGGYSVGILNLAQNTTVYLYVGGAGNTGKTAGGFNGGGRRSSYNGGGGGTDIRIGSDSLYARVIVAGGGGSDGASNKKGMYGGGTSGGTTTENFGSGGGGGTQTAGGAGGNNNAGTFGQGGQGMSASSGYGGAGGGGWYGGGGSYPDYSGDDDRGGGGGSGYVYTSSTASNYPSGCLLNSSYYLTNAQTIAGNTAFTSPTGTNETGHTGNGYIRITVIKVSSGNTLVKTTSNTWKEQKQMFINTGISTTIPSGLVELEYIESTGTQYINTEFKPNGNSGIIIDYQQIGTIEYQDALFGARQTESQAVFAMWLSSNQTYPQYGNVSYNTKPISITNNTRLIYKLDKGKASCGNNIVSFNQSSFSSNCNLTLFAMNTKDTIDSRRVSGKLYSCKIYDNDTLIRNFIPAKRISDGKCGLWDKVNFKFYTDESGGNFTAGAEKTAIAAIGTPLEYIEATGTQYLDTGITVNKNDNKELIMSCQLGNDGNYAGANGYMQYQASITGGAKGILKISYKNKIEKTYFNDALKLTNDWTSAYSGTNVKLGIFKLGETNNTWYNSSASQIGKLYYYKLYDNGTLIRDFIPAKRISDGKCGLWDKVNFKFYVDESGGNFKAGAEKTAIATVGTSIEYIQSSGTQYIDTGFKPNQDTRLEMVCSPLSVVDANDGSGFIPYGAGESYTSRAFECYTVNSQYEFNYDGQYGFIGSPSTGQKLLISHNKNEIKLIINGSTTLTKSFNYQSFTAPYTMTLFAIHRSSVIRGLMKLYSCQIYDNGTLVRDFIPCKNASGVIGLWDNVNKVFYSNAGTGAFTGGPAIALTGWHKIKGIWAKTAANTWSQAL